MDKFFRFMSWLIPLLMLVALDFIVYDDESVVWIAIRFINLETFWKGF